MSNTKPTPTRLLPTSTRPLPDLYPTPASPLPPQEEDVQLQRLQLFCEQECDEIDDDVYEQVPH